MVANRLAPGPPMQNPLFRFAAYLDQKAFLSTRLWSFSLHNIFRDFPYYFFWTALLQHPVRFWRGFRAYKHLVRTSNGFPLSGTMTFDDLDCVQKQKFLIAPGFCMKPYDYEKGKSTCPVGHFNHECHLLNDITLLQHKEKWPKSCSLCGIAPLAVDAVELQVDFYIMTSALDIARDVYLPALQNRGAQRGLFFLCPYSLEPFTVGMALAGMKGALVSFCQGDCKNHLEWTQADLGIKKNQTFVSPQVQQDVFAHLNHLKAIRGFREHVAYDFDGHLYRARTR